MEARRKGALQTQGTGKELETKGQKMNDPTKHTRTGAPYQYGDELTAKGWRTEALEHVREGNHEAANAALDNMERELKNEFTTKDAIIKERDAAREIGLKLLADLNDKKAILKLVQDEREEIKIILMKEKSFGDGRTIIDALKFAVSSPKLPIPLPDGHELVWFSVAQLGDKVLAFPATSIKRPPYWRDPLEVDCIGESFAVIARSIVKKKTKEEIEHDAACSEYQAASKVFGLAQARREAAAKAWRDAK